MHDQKNIDKHKIDLYRVLLYSNVEELSDVDVNLLYELAQDPAIQKQLDSRWGI